MARHLFVFTIALFCAMVASAADDELSDLYTDVRGEHIFEFTIHESVYPLEFHLFGNKNNQIERIDVCLKGETEPFQMIHVKDAEPPYRGAGYFEALDMNFDGYKDIRLLSWWGATGNQGHEVWTYNKETGRFEKNDALSGIGDAWIDYDKEEIYASGKAGWGVYARCIFKYIDDELVLIEEERQNHFRIQDVFLKILRKRIEGSLKIVEVTRFNAKLEPDPLEPGHFLLGLLDTNPEEQVLAALNRGLPDIQAVNQYFDMMIFFARWSYQGKLIMERIAQVIAETRPSPEKDKALKTVADLFPDYSYNHAIDLWQALDLWTHALIIDPGVIPSYQYDRYMAWFYSLTYDPDLYLRARAVMQIRDMYYYGHEFPNVDFEGILKTREKYREKDTPLPPDAPDFVKEYFKIEDFPRRWGPEHLITEKEYWEFQDASPEQQAAMAAEDPRFQPFLEKSETLPTTSGLNPGADGE